MLNSHQLEDMMEAGLKTAMKTIPSQDRRLDVLRAHTLKAMQSDTSNAVVQSLINFKNFPFFREKVIQDAQVEELESKSISDIPQDMNKDQEDVGGFSRKPVETKRRGPLRNADGEIITDDDIIEEAYTMYVENPEPLTHSTTFQIIELLNKVAFDESVL